MNIWTFSDSAEAAPRLLAPAAQLAVGGGKIKAVALDESVAQDLASRGADTVYLLKLADGRPESAMKSLAERIRADGPALVLLAATPRGREIAAGLAALLDCPMISEAHALRQDDSGELITERYLMGGMAVSTQAHSLPLCVSIAPTAWAAPEAGQTTAPVESVDIAADPSLKVLSCEPVQRDGTDLAAAAKVLCVGRGLEKEEDLALLRDLAAVLGAELGCSRGVAEDLKWMPLERYIGISGVKLRADLLVSLGISGQVQHVAGIRESKCIVAINNNENAPIFEAADYGIVGDLYEVAPLLTKALG